MERTICGACIALLAACTKPALPGVYLQFNGSTDYIEAASDPAFSVGPQGLTVTAWMRPDLLTFARTEGSLADEQYVHWLGKGAPAMEEWVFRMYSLGSPPGPRASRISFYVFAPSGGRGCGSYFQDPIVAGKWVHVAGVVDPVAQQTSIYKNAVLRHSDSYASLTLGAGSAPLRIGTRDRSSFLAGAVGQVRIWSRPLTAPELNDLFAKGVAPAAGLTAQFKIDEGSGLVARDSVGGHDGTIVSGTWQSGTGDAQVDVRTAGGGC
jgi:hypothetical protein